MTTPRRQRIDVEVRYAETDQMGVVHHSNYLVWFELARTRLCLETGVHYAAVEELGFYLVVTRAEMRCLTGATYGDVVAVDCWIERLTSRGIRFAYEVARGGQRLVTGTTDHVWVDRESGRPCRTPEPLREGFRKLAGPSSREGSS
jgi:acyl-CoA thioester hydrolase